MKVVTAEKYKEGLEKINISDKQELMLKAHFKAVGRSITYTDLAKSAGYDDYQTANSQYGKLGRLLGEAIGYSFAESEVRKDEIFYSSSIGMPNSYTDGEFQLVMHHELAEALRLLNY